MAKTAQQLHRAIMRKIYLYYGMRVLTHPHTVRVGILMIALWLLAKLVFVERVVDGFLNTPIRDIVPHTVAVVTQADFMSLFVTGVVIFTVLSAGFSRPIRYIRSLSSVVTSPRQVRFEQ